MQKNTKIILGLGLIGLAYYLWQRSSKQDVNSNIQTDRDTNKMGEQEPFESEEEKNAFYDVFLSKYQVGGRPQNGDKLTTKYGTYTFVLVKEGVAPAYYPEGYWKKI